MTLISSKCHYKDNYEKERILLSDSVFWNAQVYISFNPLSSILIVAVIDFPSTVK